MTEDAENYWAARAWNLACSVAPEPHQRALLAEHRIGVWQRDARDGFQRLGMFGLAAAAEVVLPVLRIGADHHQIGTGREALMAGAGRQNANVALTEIELLAVVAAEADLGAAARDAYALMDHRMVVHVGKDAVAPHVVPAVTAEYVLDHLFRVGRADQIDRAA